jgi:hypothetical protein
MDRMETKMLEVSVDVPGQLWNRAELAAQDEGTTVSAVLAEALVQHLACRARLRSVEAWARSGAATDFDELAEADPAFEAAGCA